MQDDLARWLVEKRTSDSSFLARLWQTALDRQPDEQGRQHFLSRLSLGTSRLVVIEDLLTSLEYKLRGAGDAAFCRHLYQLVLGREPGAGDDLDGWLDLVRSQGRQATFQAFCAAPEVDYRYNSEDSWDVEAAPAGRIMVTFRRFDARLTFGVQRSPAPLVVSAHNLPMVRAFLNDAGFGVLAFRLSSHIDRPAPAAWDVPINPTSASPAP